ncbi:MAG: hypothetical protein IKB70_03380 [Bacilli bacterium]|nr:hypothetical protein [Bacilli bacterium]
MVKTKKTDQKNYLTLNKINVNAGVISWYRSELVKLVKLMCKTYEQKILSLYTDKSSKQQLKEIKYATDDSIGSQSRILLNKLNKVYSEYYDKKGKVKSEGMVAKVEKALKKSFEMSFYAFVSKLGKDYEGSSVIKRIISQFSPETLNNKQKFLKAFALKEKVYSEVSENIKKTTIMNNTELIKSLQQQYHREISQCVYQSIIDGKPQKELVSLIKQAGAKTTRRANLIASDQVNKAHSVLYRQELKQHGIKKMRWIHLGGGKTDRKTHITNAPKGLNGAIFDVTKGLYDPSVNKYIFPAELPFCYDKNTEVYTENGFELVKDVKVGTKVLTLNPYTKNLEWGTCINTFEKDCENIAIIEGKRLHIAVDPNHTFFTYKRIEHTNGTTIEPRFTQNVYMLGKRANKFYASSEWIGKEYESIKIGNKNIPINDYLFLMGYYLSEGNISSRNTTSEIKISQYTYLDKMYEDLKYFNPHKNKTAITIYDKDLKEYLRQFGKSDKKFVPQIIKDLSKDKIRIFLNAFCLGDGVLEKTRKTNLFEGKIYNVYSTSSKRLADDLTELIIKSGMAVNYRINRNKGKISQFKNGKYELKTDIYVLQECKSIYKQLETCDIREEKYNDKVYDIEVDTNHTLLIKSKTHIHWNSNCRCSLIPILEV